MTPTECKERESGSLTSMDKIRRTELKKKSNLLMPVEEFISSKFSVLDCAVLSKGVEDLMKEVEAFRQDRPQRAHLISPIDNWKNDSKTFPATSKDYFNLSLSE